MIASRYAVCVRLFAACAAVFAAGLSAAAAQESWDAVYMGESKIGHTHTYVEKFDYKGQPYVRVRVDTVLSFRRGNDPVTISLRYGSIEKPTGEVLKLDTRTVVSRQEIRVAGTVQKGKMRLILDGAGGTQEKDVDWPDTVRGPYAVEQSISRTPLKPGEKRALKMFMPDVNEVCDIDIEAKGEEEIELGGGAKRKLLKIEQTTMLAGKHRPEFDLTMWADATGQVFKSFTDTNGGLTMYRTTKEAALATKGFAKLDLIQATSVKTPGLIADPTSTRHITYTLTLRNDDPRAVFPVDRRQTLMDGKSKGEVVLDVKTAGPNDGEAGPEGVDAQFLRPNGLINSDDREVIRLASRAVGEATEPWEKAKKIQEWVWKNIHEKNYSTAFASAKEVARDLSGDCTEHSVLVAAMCRAQGVPARVAIGLLYAENLSGFGFHMWNEVYVNRRWTAIDAVFNENEVDAVHIKVAESSLDGVSPFEAFSPVARIIDKLKFSAIDIK